MSVVVVNNPAQRRQSRLRGLWANYLEAQGKLLGLLREAKENDDYLELGYRSWTAYIADTFGAEPGVRLAREDRQELVRILSDEGMGQRAIAKTLHVSKNTVTADLQEVSQIGTPAKITVGPDGKNYPRAEPKAEPRKQRRRPITDQYLTATHELGKVAERLTKLTCDNRFDQHRIGLAEIRCADLEGYVVKLIVDLAVLKGQMPSDVAGLLGAALFNAEATNPNLIKEACGRN